MATVVDLNGIKTALKTLFDTKNALAATPRDLSEGLSRRVQKVLKVHPEMIPIQASFYPCVTCYIDDKSWELESIVGSQLGSVRKSQVFIDVVGAVWNNNFSIDTEDPADEDINKLMENIEIILRSDTTLGNKVAWQRPIGCKFYIAQIEEQTHLRAGVLRLQASVFY